MTENMLGRERSTIDANSEGERGIALHSLTALNGRSESVTPGCTEHGLLDSVTDEVHSFFLGAIFVQQIALHDTRAGNAATFIDQNFHDYFSPHVSAVRLGRILRCRNADGGGATISTCCHGLVSRIGTFDVFVIVSGLVQVEGNISDFQFDIVQHNIIRHDDRRLGDRWRWLALLLGGLLDFFYLDHLLPAGVESGAAKIHGRSRPEQDTRIDRQQAQRERAQEVKEITLPTEGIFLKLVQRSPENLMMSDRRAYDVMQASYPGF